MAHGSDILHRWRPDSQSRGENHELGIGGRNRQALPQAPRHSLADLVERAAGRDGGGGGGKVRRFDYPRLDLWLTRGCAWGRYALLVIPGALFGWGFVIGLMQ